VRTDKQHGQERLPQSQFGAEIPNDGGEIEKIKLAARAAWGGVENSGGVLPHILSKFNFTFKVGHLSNRPNPAFLIGGRA